MSELYGEKYNGAHQFGDVPGGFADPEHYNRTERWNGIAEDLIHLLHPNTVLELGCGRGSLIKAFRDRGVEAEGIDISEWSIAHPIVPEIASFIRHQAAQDIEITKTYDLIVALDIIEHIPYNFYPELFEKLQQVSSQVSLTVPLNKNGMKRFDSNWTIEHYVVLTKEDWEQEFKLRNYEIVNFEATQTFPFDKKNPENYPFILRLK